MSDRGDALTVAIAAGKLLGIAEARGIINGQGRTAIAETLRIADEVKHADPVLSNAIREAAYATLHERSDSTIEGTVVEPLELEEGDPHGP